MSTKWASDYVYSEWTMKSASLNIGRCAVINISEVSRQTSKTPVLENKWTK